MSNRQSGNEPEDSGPHPVVPGTRLKLGNFTLDLQKHALFRGTERVHLTPRPLQVLETLVRRAGEVVSKRDLMKAVWGDEFVTDDALVQAVVEVRRALEDDKDNPAFVQTVPREGYRFIAQVAVERPEGAREQPAALRSGLRVVGERRAGGAMGGVTSLLRRFRWGIGTLAVLIGGACVVYWWGSRPSGTDWSPPRLIAHISGSPHSPSFSPDGGRIAYVNLVDGVDQVFVRELGQAASTQLTSGDTPAASPRWSPTNEQILFTRGTGGSAGPVYGRQSIWSVPPLGGPAHMITEDGRNPAWSLDGSRIVFERGSDIWMAQADGGNQRRLEGVPTSEYFLADRTPSLSPDGSRIAFFHPEAGPKGDFWIMPAKGGQATRLTFDVCQGSRPVWTRDGNWLLFASERSGVSALWRVPISGGKPQLVFSATGEDRDPDISQDGRRLVFTNTRNQFVLTLLDPATRGSRELAQSRSNMTHPMFDPQGQRIALFVQDRERGADVLYTVGLNGNNLSPLTRGESGNSTFPHWSGDGAHLYFYQSSRSPSFRRIRIDGGPSSEVVAGWTWQVNYGARVDSRQKFIVYSEAHAGVPVRTLIRDISTGRERVLAKALDDPRWSRDDRLIVGVDLTAAKPPEGWISVCPADGGACRQVTKGYLPVWSADNGFIYFLRTGEFHDGAELWMTATSGGRARKLAELRPMLPIGQYYDVSPRGEVVFVQFKPGNRELWLAERPVFGSRR